MKLSEFEQELLDEALVQSRVSESERKPSPKRSVVEVVSKGLGVFRSPHFWAVITFAIPFAALLYFSFVVFRIQAVVDSGTLSALSEAVSDTKIQEYLFSSGQEWLASLTFVYDNRFLIFGVLIGCCLIFPLMVYVVDWAILNRQLRRQIQREEEAFEE